MSMKLSGHAGSCGGETLAEGIAVKVPGQITAPIIEKYVDDIVLVSERSIEWAIGALAERQRVISEGAGAAGIAALYQHKELTNGKKTGRAKTHLLQQCSLLRVALSLSLAQ